MVELPVEGLNILNIHLTMYKFKTAIHNSRLQNCKT